MTQNRPRQAVQAPQAFIGKKVYFTDGEGPLVHLDLALALMGRITFKSTLQIDPTIKETAGKTIREILINRETPLDINGADFFELLSLYDDYLAEKGTAGYQAGDTLALVVPHFLHHGITDEDVITEAKKATVCLGVKELIDGLKRDGVEVRIISTAYSQMWDLVGESLKIPKEHIACTKLDLKSLREKYQTPQLDAAVEEMEQGVLPLLPWVQEMKDKIGTKVEINGELKEITVVDVFEDAKYASLTQRLDRFYWQELRELGYEVLKDVEVVGGRRKIEAAKRFAEELGVPLSKVAFTGDSITDKALQEYLSKEGGLPMTVNGNTYALEFPEVAVATTDMRALRPVLDSWWQGGLKKVGEFVVGSSAARLVGGGKEGAPIPPEEGPYYHLLETPQDRAEALKVHKVFRRLVRGAAAALG